MDSDPLVEIVKDEGVRLIFRNCLNLLVIKWRTFTAI